MEPDLKIELDEDGEGHAFLCAAFIRSDLRAMDMSFTDKNTGIKYKLSVLPVSYHIDRGIAVWRFRRARPARLSDMMTKAV